MLTGKSILVTGGTGSFGHAFLRTVLAKYPDVGRLVVYSRDELKQFEMSQLFPETQYPQLRFFIGDVRDKERLWRAFEGIDIVIHAAALKQVPACEYNPFEAVKTNVMGAQNVIEAAIDRNVKKVVALSTDKAAAPINLYGATKLTSDKLFVSANNFRGKREIKFSVVRYGNVMGSRGSVIPFFLGKRREGVLPITSPEMTRFNITLEEGVQLMLFALEQMWGGEIFVPRIPSYRILDVAEAIAPDCEREIIGIRAGEKLHEQMITETDALNTIEFKDYFVILPSARLWDVSKYMEIFDGKLCQPGFSYCSATNTDWLTVEELRELIRQHVDPQFTVGITSPAVEGRRHLTIKPLPETAQQTSGSPRVKVAENKPPVTEMYY
ncbi:MAG: UDP-N-acetylglucosamine 4,6-dehydratase (inverting) [candidate division Zixibacteria bacterium]|nr:UDP-N-acetylglucosamine 4,6-dehydratase (inverting) [candidate division Zixibacteria bacterium]